MQPAKLVPFCVVALAACHGSGEPAVAPAPASDAAASPSPAATATSASPTSEPNADLGAAARDLQRICAIVEEERARGGEAIATVMAVAQRWDAEVTVPGLRKAIEVLAAAVGQQRYRLMIAAAAEEGVADWQCPALEELWAEALTD